MHCYNYLLWGIKAQNFTTLKIKIQKNENFWASHKRFFYFQHDKITPEAGKKYSPFYFLILNFCYSNYFSDAQGPAESSQNEENYKCKKCGELCSTLNNLKKHTNVVHESIMFHKCKYCEKTFDRSSKVRHHINTFHKGKAI